MHVLFLHVAEPHSCFCGRYGSTLCLLAGGVLGLQVLEGEVGDDTAEEDNAVEGNAAAS
jgi:hypothetical protein